MLGSLTTRGTEYGSTIRLPRLRWKEVESSKEMVKSCCSFGCASKYSKSAGILALSNRSRVELPPSIDWTGRRVATYSWIWKTKDAIHPYYRRVRAIIDPVSLSYRPVHVKAMIHPPLMMFPLCSSTLRLPNFIVF